MIRSIQACLAKTKSQFATIFGISSYLVSTKCSVPYPIVEEPDYYKSGGFHPVSLSDSFHSNRLIVLRKLGHGQYFTECVALKNLRADCRHHVSHPLEEFKHNGPNGKHVCFVFDVFGHYLGFQTAKHEDGRLPITALKKITRLILLRLDFLHRECGPTNLLFGVEDSETVVSKYLSETPARTDPHHCTKSPLRGVIPTPLLSETDNVHIRIIDFGVSSWRTRHLANRIQPPALRAPEVTIGAPWDTGVDIRRLGCLPIMGVLSPFPLDFIEKGGRAEHFLDKQGIHCPALMKPPLIPHLKSTSLECLVNGSTAPFDLETRKPAAELLQHEWLRL
ncbi:kinase-like domain-containing protein [Aspergillus spectabilis]